MQMPASQTLPWRGWLRVAAVTGLGLLGACMETTRLPPGADSGSTPSIAKPVKSLLPTVHIAPATGWPSGRMPLATSGLQVSAFARELSHPRWLIALPNGDVLVAESNAPPRPAQSQGLKGLAMKWFQKRAGAGVPSANRITLLRDADGDGSAEVRSVLLSGLNSPFGMALVGDQLFVAHTDAVVAYAYTAGVTRIDAASGRRLTELPAGDRNHHWTKALVASPDGTKLYATVGSNSNVAEHGMAEEEGRAAIWEIDIASGRKRLFATGLRNPNGMAWTADGVLWTVVNERDELGSDLVPDYLTSVRDGGFYGWPYSYFGQHVDSRVKPARPDLVAKALVPDFALGSHVAPLGLVASGSSALTDALGVPTPASAVFTQVGMFVGNHGSWNRRPHAGYNVVFVRFDGHRPVGKPVEVLGGFVNADGKAMGRPVGVAIDSGGALLVADDVGNTVWRVNGRAR